MQFKMATPEYPAEFCLIIVRTPAAALRQAKAYTSRKTGKGGMKIVLDPCALDHYSEELPC